MFLLFLWYSRQFCALVYVLCLVAQSCPALCNSMDCSSSVHGDSSGKNTGMVCHTLLQGGVFPTQGSNPGLLHCRRILHLSHQGSLGKYALVSKILSQRYAFLLKVAKQYEGKLRKEPTPQKGFQADQPRKMYIWKLITDFESLKITQCLCIPYKVLKDEKR